MVENGQSKIKTLSQQTRTRKATNTLKPQFQLKKVSAQLCLSAQITNYPGPRSQTIVFGWTDNTNKQTIKQSNNPLKPRLIFLAVNSPTHAHTKSKYSPTGGSESRIYSTVAYIVAILALI
jgi:hypothetical protein